MAATITYNGNTIRESNRTESFTLLTNNLIMKSDIVIYVDAETRVEVVYNGETLNLDTDPGEHTYNLLCANKLMLSNLTISVSIEGSINYTNVIKCTTNEDIELPSSNIMIVVIGGGTGGQGGYKGEAGSKPVSTGSTSYREYQAVLKATDTLPYAVQHVFTINPSAIYKSVSLNTSTGVLTFSNVLNPNSNNQQVSGQVRLSQIANGYRVRKDTNSSYWMDILDGGTLISRYYTVTSTTVEVSGKYKYNSYTKGGSGGNGGVGGQGGKVFKKELTVTSGEIARVTIGTGGAAGASGGKYGSAGSPTTVIINGVTYSSDDGILMPDGFVNTVDTIEPEVYASQGIDGIKGASGGGYNSYYNSEIGNGVLENVGGAVGSNYKTSGTNAQYIGGGSGGGAAYGASGYAGGPATQGKTGKGGNGATAGSVDAAINPGCGGNGGHGGGGGGNAGGSQISGVVVSSAGNGGSGGAASAGANGIVLIYYNAIE